ncbi:MAG: penicillin-binding protein activator [Alphaproteobacteria bacterium]|nr:penicillin-binding protein activator [Alphaproteobacteria bacterium]
MFKRICAISALFFLLSCSSPLVVSRSYFTADNEVKVSKISEQEFVTPSSFRVGVLLPLSGDAAKAGQGLKNAAMLALEDMNNPNLILQFYDTQSTPEGARVAVANAINQRVRLIIGPLRSSEVEAISYQTRSRNIPVIAFSTDESILQKQVYTLGLLIDEQVSRIIEYAAEEGRTRFALLVPDNLSGTAVAASALKAAKRNGGSVVKIAFYAPNTNDFSDIVKQLSNYENRAENGLDFDAVLIPESGSRLKSAAAMFGYYDVFAPEVMFLGTSIWENTNLNKETTLKKAVYPVLSRSHSAYFNKKYQSLYGNYPNGLFSFAYDAVALSSALARRNPQNLDAAITTPDGFAGINGVFRIFANGKNQHSMDVMQITPSADVVVNLAEQKFPAAFNESSSADIASLYDSAPPQIFGKDPAIVQQELFGRELGLENQNFNYRGFLFKY